MSKVKECYGNYRPYKQSCKECKTAKLTCMIETVGRLEGKIK